MVEVADEVCIPAWVVGAVGGSAVKVYLTLAKMQEHGLATPHREIVKVSGLSNVTVQRALAELADVGAIKREYQRTENGMIAANTYTLVKGAAVA